jgi:putative DNA primase/helicase
MDENTKADAIRQYTAAGVYVNPVYVSEGKSGKKKVEPVGKWRDASSRSAADVEAWFGHDGAHRAASVLIDCGKSRLVVIDPDGPEGIANWEALGVPATPARVRTPGGGRHDYYREHPAHLIGNDQDGKIAEHVDVRGVGGFVIAPPSTDWRGAYEWLDGPPNWADIPVVPGLVIERMTTKAAPAPTGARDDFYDSPGQGERLFTEQEATDFVLAAYAKLKAARSGLNGAINSFAMACAHFPIWFPRERCARLVIKALGPSQGWTAPDAEDWKTIESAYGATEAGRSWTAIERPTVSDSVRGHGQAEPTGGELPAPTDPLAVARALVARMTTPRAWWREDFYRHTGTHWEVTPASTVEQWLYRQTEDATFVTEDSKGEKQIKRWSPTRKKIGDLSHALGVGAIQHEGDEVKCLATLSGVLERTAAARTLWPHSADRFNLHCLPFAYDPEAECPAWHTFLEQVLPGDRQAHEFLAEWFGYVLSGRTEQQKMAALIGKRRSGKGTVARVLGALLGKESAVGLDLNLLGGTFGLENLIGKSLAVSGDVRWHSRTVSDAVPVLLQVIGEDVVSVHRKNRTDWTGALGVRFMLMSNDTPTFSDRSGALSGRVIYLKFDQTFYGREDTSLTEKLIGELPGILNWALDGLDRLDGRGRFSEPESGMAEADAVRRLSDPIGAFLDDWCEIGPEHSISLDHLYLKYQDWCVSGGRTRDTTTKEIFSRDLRSKIKDLAVKRVQENGRRGQILTGVGSDAL